VLEWFAVHTLPRMEGKAVFNLERQGFTVYCPKHLKRRSHARRVDRVPAPLFPRYLFVAIDRAVQGWRSIRSTMGVADIVRAGDEPAPVPGIIVDEIRAREDANGYVALLPAHRLTKGQSVQIVEGAFAGAKALVECLCDEQRVTLLIDMLGRRVAMKIPLDDLALSA
jgi:transcriptional antiterminator RfaH